MFGLQLSGLTAIAVLGAHCDDIAIGMGATLTQLCRNNPGVAVDALVLTGGDGPRASEERAALTALTPGARTSVRIEDFPDGRTPSRWSDVKAVVKDFAAGIDPQVVFGPQLDDRHQDHRLLAELIGNEFRGRQAFGYEILKWENDLPTPDITIPVTDEAAETKVDALAEHYPSQADHYWFEREVFLGLMRVRGVSAMSRYAEGFVTDTLVVTV